MSKFTNEEITIFTAMKHIQNGHYVIPAFQRQFVWNMTQIEKLWDSILCNYPISNFLFWHVNEKNTTNDTYFMSFLDKATFSSRLQSDGENNNYSLSCINPQINNTAILDGQQRLTALYLSLYGDLYIRQKYTRKSNIGGIVTKLFIELNKNKLSINEEEYNSKKFDIKFTTKIGLLSPTSFEIRKILNPDYMDEEKRKELIEKEISKVPENSKDYARNIIESLYRKIYEEKIIRSTTIDDMNQDDALEMFVRFNSGGKALKKSEITMSILEAYWPQAKEEFGKILTNKYRGFSSDFIIRTALMLFGDVIKSTINKYTVNELKNNWNSFKLTLENLAKILEQLNINISRFTNSWNVLLPIIYHIYYNPSDYLQNINDIRAYLIRAILFTYFQSGTTAKLQQMKSNMNEFGAKITIEMLNQMSELSITQGKIDDLLSVEKGSRIAGEILYYLSKDWINPNYKYEQDHLHPYDRFNESKPLSITIETWTKWKSLRNKLPNLQLLEGRSNGSKCSMPLIEYYNQKNDDQKKEFKEKAYIPDVSLEIENFEEFYLKRSAILQQKIKELMQ